MLFWFLRAAKMAPSFIKLARSAPEKPGVLWATFLRLMSLLKGFSREWILRISSRSFRSGRSRMTRRSKRPGRRRAGSRMSGRLVAARTMTRVSRSKPSSSTRIWFKVCSLSSFPPPRPAPRWRPTASISSIKRIEGEAFLAVRNASRVREAPTPTNISTNSEAEMWKKGTLLSPAVALANRVFPVPGKPTKRTPRGILAPRSKNFFGFFRNSTTSANSSFASLRPATSLKRIFSLPKVERRRLERPKLKAWLTPDLACRNIKKKINPIIMTGIRVGIKIPAQNCQPDWSSTLSSTFWRATVSTPRFFRVSVKLASVSFLAVTSVLSLRVIASFSPLIWIWATSPELIFEASSPTLISFGVAVFPIRDEKIKEKTIREPIAQRRFL